MNLCKLKNRIIQELQDDNLICYCIALVSILFNLVMIFHHEAWRDEAQAWLIAKDASIFELFNNILSYEGHPCLWYLILMPFAKLGFPYITMHFISFAFMSATTIIFVRYSPFSKIITCIAVISPIFVYFLPVISRSYSVLAFLIILLAWQYPQRLTHPFRYCILIALMIQTHVYAIGLAFGLCFVQLCEVIRIFWKNKKGKSKNSNTTNIKNNILALLIPLSSALFLLFEFRYVQNASYPQKKIENIILFVKYTFFNEMFFNNKFLFIILCCFFIVLVILSIKLKFVKILLIFFISVLYIVIVKYNFYNSNSDRYLTIVYFFVWYLWSIVYSLKPSTISFEISNIKHLLSNICTLSANMVILVFSMLYMIHSFNDVNHDYSHMYSTSHDISNFIEYSLPENAVIFENCDDFCNAVVAYNKNKIIYNPFNQSKASYCVRNKQIVTSISYEDFIEIAHSMFPDNKDIYLLCSKATDISINQIYNIPNNLEIVYETQETHESFYIYHIYL